MSDAFTCSIAIEPDGACIRLAGELDFSSAPRLKATVRSALTDDPLVLTIDLRDVSFMDSSGLAALLGAHRAAEAAGARLTFTRAPPAIRRLLAMSNLDSILRIT